MKKVEKKAHRPSSYLMEWDASGDSILNDADEALPSADQLNEWLSAVKISSGLGS
ncbi:hypothetical protein SAMN04515674_10641 [Pseudarcicella hirudinis]|uniref:Uncharacterized protein n=1 Tax=Pseudarcicella hirudinis TaxID=1079859 RepID=A0A1I5TGJ0_9BACT|nr:hypothetical protein [Pseudarcicella hirudinis]SFP82174.1 hypothetical protein SAMN04515674_10641 [Pseudarcicella hirudinis]